MKTASIWTAAVFTAAAMTGIATMTMPAIAQQANADGDQATIDKGKVTYAQKCSHCHGPNMVNSGTVTPDLRTHPDDKTRFVTTVKQGKNGKMPPWGDILSDEEISDLWAFVASRRKP
ncbi:Cytochrome C oxidase, cbb3-type, subunit III [Bradyrhizobium brasilense]|uniref:Cytochrome C oxidase, cbb3-type, subunit III n=2 Tax=Nitrobacteraceae TaxID=41294 RepID=A0A1G6UXG6_9BRAD|nr:Cytochrome C oxidase, cbb3-type, subunit III [Bradyrhizobium brasilense]